MPSSEEQRAAQLVALLSRRSSGDVSSTGAERFAWNYILVAAGLVVLLVLGEAFWNLPSLRGEFPEGIAQPITAARVIPSAALLALGPVLAAGWWLVVLCRLGPVSVSPAMLVWVFQHPVEREVFLRSRRRGVIILSMVCGLVTGWLAMVPGTVQDGWTLWPLGAILWSLLLFGLAGTLAVRRQYRRAGGALGWCELSSAAGQLVMVEANALSLDFNGMSRLLYPAGQAGPVVPRPFPSWCRGRPAAVQVLLEARMLARCRSVGWGWCGTLALASAAPFSSLTSSPLLFLLGLSVLGLAAARASASGLRHLQGNPYRYALLPHSDRVARWVELLVPTVLTVVWALVQVGVLCLLLGRFDALPLSLLSAPGAAACSVMDADREPPDWGPETMVATSMGPVPVVALTQVFTGAFLTLLVCSGPSLAATGLLPVPAAGCLLTVLSVLAVWMCLRRSR